MSTLLIVEDHQLVMTTPQKQFARFLPDLDVSFVTDAANAAQAIFGNPYFEYFPDVEMTRGRKGTAIGAVIWDNQFPRTLGGRPEQDVGLETAAALSTSGKVNALLRSRFILHSADKISEEKTNGIFAAVLPKPIHFPTLRGLLREWNLIEAERKEASLFLNEGGE